MTDSVSYFRDKGLASTSAARDEPGRSAPLRPASPRPDVQSAERKVQNPRSVFWTCKGQLTLERHGGRTHQGLAARVALRLLALAAAIWHNSLIGQPGRHLASHTR